MKEEKRTKKNIQRDNATEKKLNPSQRIFINNPVGAKREATTTTTIHQQWLSMQKKTHVLNRDKVK